MVQRIGGSPRGGRQGQGQPRLVLSANPSPAAWLRTPLSPSQLMEDLDATAHPPDVSPRWGSATLKTHVCGHLRCGDSGWLASGGHSNNRVSRPVLFSHGHGWRLTHCGQAEGHVTHTRSHSFSVPLLPAANSSMVISGKRMRASALPKTFRLFSGVTCSCCR